ncbi:endoribonuclease YbeY [Gammaproteobacteria bacterium]
MSINLVVQNIGKSKSVPSKKQFKTWVEKVLAPRKKNHELTIRIVGIKEITKLNKQYRKKNKPTNIISFNFYPPANIKTNLLGDLVICAPIVKLEAKLQHKTVLSHWAHLTVHGVLHLLGYDHQNDDAAQKMERLEIKILKKIGIANPYKP